jgi:peptidoglycan/xylan/chitin deacetylase (PgdA/CDA1 family)
MKNTIQVYLNNLEVLLSIIYPKLTWTRKTSEKVIYLTFDDGPIPDVTEYVLNELDKYKAKATFFCVGENVSKNDLIFHKIINRGHKIGNHTFNHINGWKNNIEDYMENIAKADFILTQNLSEENISLYRSSKTGKKLFRPPYGKIKKNQIKALEDHYEIVMWNVLTGDFDKNLPPEKCLRTAIKYTGKGSIVIFHDSLKALPNLQFALPKFLKHFTEAGYRFESL